MPPLLAVFAAGGSSPVDTAAVAGGLCYRAAGILSVHLQGVVHGLTAAAFQRHDGVSRAEAGDPGLWEAACAAEAAGFLGLAALD